MADMLEALAPEPRMRVLEIGTGTGYNAALLAEIVGKDGLVATLEIDADLSAVAEGRLENAGYEQVRVLARDGAEGLPEASPFDRILATVGCPDVAPAWHEQLAKCGWLVAPLEHTGLHPLVSLTKRGELLQGHFVGWSSFIPIRGLLQQQLLWPDAVLGEGDRSALAVSPAWDGFGSGPPIPGWGVPHDVMDFFLFLALSDRRTVALPPPPGSIGDRWEVGLLDTSGSAFAGASGLRRGGDPGLFMDLTSHHDSWLAAGCPALEDWLVTFAAHSVEGARFFVERDHYNEAVTLPEG